MPKFMDVHRGMKGLTADQLMEAHRADLAIEKDENVHFEHAWADPESGIVYCLSEAPSADAVQRIHERAGHRADEVHQVTLEA
ncbi:SCO4226 family nickel-binding protein [Streptomyces actinomycinicus]|uniref:SCO4226 family nickel-binding protein n=1 Tax=Streptomyces actinomycinicus TaxID=1695166 RepID=A0A937EGE2_9ACTN|nr:SCO4226 family nickel-binding protein [Streptomyces actinomycinicus]MBL1081810.1 SCO4226 family nickel-binding protein [Streptomyces actinomycinicus]